MILINTPAFIQVKYKVTYLRVTQGLTDNSPVKLCGTDQIF